MAFLVWRGWPLSNICILWEYERLVRKVVDYRNQLWFSEMQAEQDLSKKFMAHFYSERPQRGHKTNSSMREWGRLISWSMSYDQKWTPRRTDWWQSFLGMCGKLRKRFPNTPKWCNWHNITRVKNSRKLFFESQFYSSHQRGEQSWEATQNNTAELDTQDKLTH